jgi:BON domain
MQNRYDRERDDERSNPRRDERSSPYGEYSRSSGDRDRSYQADRYQADRSQGERDEQERQYGERPWRSGDDSSSQYQPRQNYPGSYYGAGSPNQSSGSSSWNPSGQGSFGQGSSNRWREQERQYEQSGRSDAERSAYGRGTYREQSWLRDPNTGHLHGYEYSGRFEPRYGQFEDSRTDRSGSPWLAPRGRNESSDPWRPLGQSGADPRGQSARGMGGYYGKGPKGYTRSDDRIREDVCDRLSDDDIVDASEISVQVKDGEVTLEGSVTDRHMKHRAEDIIEEVSGVRDVNNKLRTKKSFMQELGDKFTGDDENEHRGHSGSGTRNSPPASPLSGGTKSPNPSH